MTDVASPSRPVLELLVAPGTSDAIAALAAALARWADVRAPDAALGRPAARLASTPDAPGVEAALEDPTCPLAVLVASPVAASADDGVLDRAALVLVPDGLDPLARDRAPALMVPAAAGPASAHRPLAPFVRSRWRRRFGFPERYVVSVGFDDASGPEPDLVASALTLASAAAVRGPHLELALALGTPTVTDTASARALRLTPGQEVLVAEGADARAVTLDELSTDAPLAAALSRAGRRAAERHDLGAVAHRVATVLGLTVCGQPPSAAIRHRLDELGTPADAGVRQRVRARLRDLGRPSGVAGAGA